jgi:hypothetical protein
MTARIYQDARHLMEVIAKRQVVLQMPDGVPSAEVAA